MSLNFNNLITLRNNRLQAERALKTAEASMKALTEIVETRKANRKQIALLDIPVLTWINPDKLKTWARQKLPAARGNVTRLKKKVESLRYQAGNMALALAV